MTVNTVTATQATANASKVVGMINPDNLNANIALQIPPQPTAQLTPIAIFKQGIADAVSSIAGYHKALYSSLGKAYTLYCLFSQAENDKKLQDSYETAVNVELAKRSIPFTPGKTQIDHKLIHLTLGQQTTASASQKARVMRKAFDATPKVLPEEFEQWISDKGGVAAILEPETSKTKSKGQPKVSVEEHVKLVKSATSFFEDSDDMCMVENDALKLEDEDRLTEPTPMLAIGIRHRDGSFTIKAFVNDAKVMEAALLANNVEVK